MARIDVDYGRFQPKYKKNSYNPHDSLAFALASHLAYDQSVARVKTQFNDWGFPQVKVFDVVRGKDVDTQGVIAVDSKRILVAFRGSELKVGDWWANFQAVKDPGPFRKTKVHEGFQDAFLPAALDIGIRIGEHRTDQDIWVTGHSLGGALAALLVATLLEDKIPVAGLYTFGAPRVGNHDFAKELNARMGKASQRVVNLGDIVPHLPPEYLGFSHTGKRVLFHGDGRRSTSSADWVESKVENSSWLVRKAKQIVKGFNVKNHHILDGKGGYIYRLQRDL